MSTAIGMVSFYPKMKASGDRAAEKINPYEGYNIQQQLSNSVYVLYKNMLEKEEGRSIKPSEIFTTRTEEDKLHKSSEVDSEDQSYVSNEVKIEDNTYSGNGSDGKDNSYNIDRLNNIYFNFEGNLNENLRNLEYSIISKKSGTEYSRSEGNLSLLAKTEEMPVEELERLDSYYGYYMVIQYDEVGNTAISKVKGADERKVAQVFNGRRNDRYANTGSIIENPKDVTVVYGIPKELKYSDLISNYVNNSKKYAYGDVVLVYALVAFAIIMFVALVIPYRGWRKIVGLEQILRIPFEILVVLITLVSSAVAIAPTLVYKYSLGNIELIAFMEKMGIGSASAETVFGIGNVIYWAVLFVAAFIGIVVIKNIFHVGIKKYFKQNTLVGKILVRIKRLSIKVYNSLVEVDLNDKSNKLLIKILAINFIILSILCSTWFFGIGISIVYSIVLFFLLKKYFNDVREKYSILLKATNKIAEGNLDVKIEEDLGLFEPFKGEIEKIQQGFKKAVDEEVKSQKMKTELISNVSHDLKTPLTSIITYVDLLKSENITEKERNDYIDTLDRKSQRLKTLIEDLFEMSKVSSRNIQLNIIDVDIVALMKQTQFELSDQIESSTLKFKCNFPEEKLIVPLDSQKTFRVFENLLVNIVKYSMENSRVFIDITKEEDRVYVTLKNMSANEIDFTAEEIVERFSRGDKSRNTEGSGLGLAIAKSFVELQGGSFDVEIDGDMFKVKIGFRGK